MWNLTMLKSFEYELAWQTNLHNEVWDSYKRKRKFEVAVRKEDKKRKVFLDSYAS